MACEFCTVSPMCCGMVHELGYCRADCAVPGEPQCTGECQMQREFDEALGRLVVADEDAAF